VIRDIAPRLKARLSAKACPIPLVVQGEQSTNTGARERIVLQRDYDASESFAQVLSQRANAKHIGNRAIRMKFRVYAQSAKAGALSIEHEERVDRIVDVLLACLDRTLRQDLQVVWRLDAGGLVRPEDLEESERLPGAVYELKFSADRAATDINWQGDARPELEVGDDLISNTTQVSLQYGPENAPVETGCGG